MNIKRINWTYYWTRLFKGFVIQVSVALVQLGARSLHLLLGINQTCRFTPSCRCYASQAISEWGIFRGMKLTARRLLRCHPFGEWGWDPVPRKGNRFSP